MAPWLTYRCWPMAALFQWRMAINGVISARGGGGTVDPRRPVTDQLGTPRDLRQDGDLATMTRHDYALWRRALCQHGAA